MKLRIDYEGEIPISCGLCEFCMLNDETDELICNFVGDDVPDYGIHKDCPIKEVPEDDTAD